MKMKINKLNKVCVSGRVDARDPKIFACRPSTFGIPEMFNKSQIK
jgi:hypothetical protein